MASTGRPSRLLNLQKSPASNKAIAARNATTSPFLKLPAEIRQTIYGYALGGRILHVASGRMSGPNSVVVCVNCDDFTNGLDQQIIRDGTVGVRTVENRRATHSQLQSHTKCYRAHETWSLNLLKVCRQIYHEAVLVPFKKNAFAVMDGITPESTRPLLAEFLDRLIPAQAKAIAHLILQGPRICGARRPTLARLKGLQVFQFILVIEHHWFDMPDSWSYYCEYQFTDRKLGNLGLPQLCDVSIQVRKYELPGIQSRPDRLPDGLMEWAKSVEIRIKS